MAFVPEGRCDRSLSLRDKGHSPIDGPRIKLGLMGFNPGKYSRTRFALKGRELSHGLTHSTRVLYNV
jgi:hypothetical protein